MNLAQLAKSQTIPKVEGKNFTCLHTGPAKDLHQYEIEHPRLKRSVPGKLFVRDHLGSTSMQVSLTKLPAGRAVPFLHAHKQNEEVYIFTGGKGEMQVDGQIFEVSEGSVVRIAPSGLRSWRNTGDSDLICICIQAKDGTLSQDTFEDGLPSEEPVKWD